MAKSLAGWCVVPLLSIASLAAAGSDFRLADAVKNKDKEAVRALLKQKADVNAPQPSLMARRRSIGRPTGMILRRQTC